MMISVLAAFHFALLAGGAQGAPLVIDRERVCEVTRTYFNTRYREAPEVWNWNPEAARTIEAHRWSVAVEELIRACPSATIPVVGLSFSEDGDLVQITRSSYAILRDPDPDPDLMEDFGGSIDTCLLRRDSQNPEGWTLIDCKLDMTS